MVRGNAKANKTLYGTTKGDDTHAYVSQVTYEGTCRSRGTSQTDANDDWFRTRRAGVWTRDVCTPQNVKMRNFCDASSARCKTARTRDSRGDHPALTFATNPMRTHGKTDGRK